MDTEREKPIVLGHEASKQIIPICLRAIRRRREREKHEPLTAGEAPQPSREFGNG